MPVDQYVPGAANYSVVKHEGKYLSCYLLMSDVKNNNNKFYIIQVVQTAGASNIFLFTRYGRVGDRGVTSFDQQFGNASKEYFKTFKAKTRKGY